ncbi:hypothetical protein [[Mycobacterium] wendilense]|uniref:Secreted protein n=1 Tax=[Mycobacterium] wendilense TaxID=3064284 RepID=A0ABM9MF33_9MYCO|nr:hypothetical protein [Mycolicibacterium sp. MU0050]CAJ1583588.1 hypothetical protein MU0050_002699 [Mycolicibacterium sp. MU0050]
MNTYDTPARPWGSRFHIARSRGAASGLLLVLLGIWGALIPFVGPYLNFAYNPDEAWVWTEARGWLEVLPGAVAVLGGLMLLLTRNRATAMLGGWLAVAAGVWFIVGRTFAATLNVGEIGEPAATTAAKTVALELAYFSALGAFVVFLGAVALGRLSVRTVRDIEYAERRVGVVPHADHDDVSARHERLARDERVAPAAPVAAEPATADEKVVREDTPVAADRNGETVTEPTVRRSRSTLKERLAQRFGRHRTHRTPVSH